MQISTRKLVDADQANIAAFDEIVGVRAGLPAGEALLRFMQRKVLNEVYKLDTAHMVEVMKYFGPMDWRVVDAHSLYWVTQSIIKGGETMQKFGNDKINSIINQGLRDLASRFRWPWLQTTTTIAVTSGTRSYALPSDFQYMHSVLRADTKIRLRATSPPKPRGAHGGDFLTGRRTIFFNDELHVAVDKPTEHAQRFCSNGDGVELYFVTSGAGHVESVYGLLPFRRHDYLLIPKSTPYRIHLDGDSGTLLVFEGRPHLGIPGRYRNKFGQLTDYAPYSPRDFRPPMELLTFDGERHGQAPYELVVKMSDRLTVHKYKHFPLDVVGWDGFVYPLAFNIHDFQPITGMVHQPPTTHTTFADNGFVVCSFVPRMVDCHEKAIPCPYAPAVVAMHDSLSYV